MEQNVCPPTHLKKKKKILQQTLKVSNYENWKEAYQETMRMQSIASFEDDSVSH
jgi:hypothetical protein